MASLFLRIPFILELFFSGIYIVVFSLKFLGKFPFEFLANNSGTLLIITSYIIPFVIFISILANFIYSSGLEEFFRKYIFSIIIFIPLLLTIRDLQFVFWLSSAHLLSSILSLYDNEAGVRDDFTTGRKASYNLFQVLKLSPAQLVLSSFLLVIVAGTFSLLLPFATKPGVDLSFWDAVFIATSATCVTGLTPLSISGEFSMFGQIIILFLIQIGGLGIMTLSSSMAILLGKSMGMKDRVVLQDLLDINSMEDLVAMVTDIVRYTLVIELWGAVILTFAFTYDGFEFTQALYYGVFHSISAFCNAGFALFDNSLESYALSPLVHGTVSLLVILGGLGFIVLKETRNILLRPKSFARLTLHTKIVYVMTAGLTLAGALFIFFGEFLGALDGYTLFEKIQISFFQSVTLRTAGFNTIPLTNLNSFTIYGISLMMFIGASPGSTGGGIKTTTLAILLQSIRSTIKGVKDIDLYDRSIQSATVVRATALTFISIIITSGFILLMMKIEPEQSFLSVFFEVISAGGTVGLSLGVTPLLSVAGKLAISLVMFIGRVGPITLLLAIGQQKQVRGKFDYPVGRIMIG